MVSAQPRKQRKMLFNAPLHRRRKWLAAHLDEPLLLKYDRRSLPVIKGDTVKIMRGIFKGHVNKVIKVDVKRGFVEVEGAIMTKADGKKVAKPIHPSNLLITKLNLTDPWRRRKLEKGLPEEVRKEIEKEAEEQLREMEEEKAKELAEKEEEVAEEAKEIKKEEKPEEKKEEKKPKEKKTEAGKKKSKASTKKTATKTTEKKPAKTGKKPTKPKEKEVKTNE